jgi:3-deoxy-D-manno-octulosonic-acid transferase
MEAIFFKLYAALMWLAQPLLRRKLARRAVKEPGYGESIGERFGYYTQPAEVRSELVWLHAVSLGETRTAAILLKALRDAQPGLRILLTHGTATGRGEGAGLLRPGDVQAWQPWDSPGAVARFLIHFKPQLGLLMETEVWPCLMTAAHQRAVPMVLVNARLSEKTLQQTLRLSPLALPAYAALSAVLAQTDADASRFAQLGITAQVVGNLKFDATPDAALLARGQVWRRGLAQPVVMFASSREGEEKLIFEAIQATVQANIDGVATDSVARGGVPRWLVVPRHPQRFDEVQALADQHGLRVSRRSAWPEAGPAGSPSAQAAEVWLGDSLGEMPLYYALADAALLGGSFAPLGGQNLIEAAACACPVVMGPHTFNFAEAASQAEAAGAAQRVPDMAAGLVRAVELAQQPAEQARAAAAATAFAAGSRGATARTVSALQVWFNH